MVARLVVIGGDAGGMSAASAAKRELGDDLEVVVLERGQDTSFSACGIPYWIAGDITERERLVARSPEEHRRRGIDVRLGHEVVALDLLAKSVRVRTGAGEHDLAYDHLLIATGAEPRRPDLPGLDADGIVGIQTLSDGDRLFAELAHEPQRAVVVGSGYVGLEMAEALHRRGLEVSVIDRSTTPLHLLAPELGDQVEQAMAGLEIGWFGGRDVTGFEVRDGRVSAVLSGDERFDADLVVLGLGVTARTSLARAAGLPAGKADALVIDPYGRVEGADSVWAAGDCALVTDRLTGRTMHLPLGTHANKQGRVAGLAIAATVRGEEPTLRFPGVVRTAITRLCELEIGVTGLRESGAAEVGFDPVVATIDSTTTAGYFPGAEKITVRVVADRRTRRLLGAQIVGQPGAAWRIDTLAMALWSELTVDELAMTDLAYAPPFSPVWDPVQVAARAAMTELDAAG